jgi:uncharacterized cofD-like protein
MNKNPNIVVIGGGTGSFMLLSALKFHTKNITAIVNMVDDGGSTGVLRDEVGVLPPGDVRQCLVALSDSPRLRDLFNYRFEGGTFDGHSFGNLFLAALEKSTGSFADAIMTASEVLSVQGQVLPVTLDDVRLRMEWPDGEALEREVTIDAAHFPQDPKLASLSVVPMASANPKALLAISKADVIVIAPGDLYTSLGPLLVTRGVGDAIRASKARKVYVCNLTTKPGQTDGLTVEGHVDEIERIAGGRIIDTVLYNSTQPAKELIDDYEKGGARIVKREGSTHHTYSFVSGDFLGEPVKRNKNEVHPVTRGLIRHDSEKIAIAIMQRLNEAL